MCLSKHCTADEPTHLNKIRTSAEDTIFFLNYACPVKLFAAMSEGVHLTDGRCCCKTD